MSEELTVINPIAERLITLAGGVKKLAKMLNISERWVYKWRHPRDKGGTGGNVPSIHHRSVLELAKKKRWAVTADDLLVDG